MPARDGDQTRLAWPVDRYVYVCQKQIAELSPGQARGIGSSALSRTLDCGRTLAAQRPYRSGVAGAPILRRGRSGLFHRPEPRVLAERFALERPACDVSAERPLRRRKACYPAQGAAGLGAISLPVAGQCRLAFLRAVSAVSREAPWAWPALALALVPVWEQPASLLPAAS